MTSSSPVKFDPTRVIKEGYMTKSPPLDEETFIRKRWRMRWFVLCYIGEEPALFYFKNEKCRKQGKPKGKISLVGTEIHKQRCRVNGYPHVINVQTNDRLYYLCSTQLPLHEDWLEKLRDHHVANTEVASATPPPPTCCRVRPSISVEDILSEVALRRNSSITSNTSSVTSNSDEDYDHPYAHKPSYASRPENSHHHHHCPQQPYSTKTSSLPRPRRPTETDYEDTRNQSLSLPIEVTDIQLEIQIGHGNTDKRLTPKRILPGLYEDEGDACDSIVTGLYEDEEDMNDPYVTMEAGCVKEDKKTTTTACESEDEGIGRSDSDSSGTSSVTNSIPSSLPNCIPSSSPNYIPSSLPKSLPMSKLFQDAMRSSICENDPLKDAFYGRGFVGPRLTSTTKKKKDLTRTKSLGDINLL